MTPFNDDDLKRFKNPDEWLDICQEEGLALLARLDAAEIICQQVEIYITKALAKGGGEMTCQNPDCIELKKQHLITERAYEWKIENLEGLLKKAIEKFSIALNERDEARAKACDMPDAHPSECCCPK
jgi:hypothetical protein